MSASSDETLLSMLIFIHWFLFFMSQTSVSHSFVCLAIKTPKTVILVPLVMKVCTYRIHYLVVFAMKKKKNSKIATSVPLVARV